MTKKKAQNRKNLSSKKLFKIVKKPNSSKKSRQIKQNLETEPRNIETQKSQLQKRFFKKIKKRTKIYLITIINL